MLDLLLSILPRYTMITDPSISVALIHAIARQAGFNSHTVDFNLTFHQKMHAHEDKDLLVRIDEWMELNPSTPIEKSELEANDRKELDKIYDIWLDIIDEHKPEYLGLSIFTTWSIKPAIDFIPWIKKRFPDLKIIIGGCGTTPRNDRLYEMADYYVDGEGDIAIVEILNGRGLTCPGVNGNPPKQIEDLDAIPYPDYSNFALSEYTMKGNQVRITSSRGCIRRCNFCDVYKIWPIYRYRSGKLVANEMFYQWSTLPGKPEYFLFTDSLLNGNMPMLREMCKELIKFKEENVGFRPKFFSQFIIPSPKFMTSDDWVLLEQAGCHKQFIGIESASEKVRLAMNKKVKDEWVTFYVQKSYEHNINMLWFFIVGFPPETTEDFFKTVRFCDEYKWMNEKEHYDIRITMTTYALYDSVWVQDHQDEFHYDQHDHWVHGSMTNEIRWARFLFLQKKIVEWGYTFKTPILPHITDFSNLEQIYIDRYGIKMFGDYDLYLEYKDELENGYEYLK